MSVILITALMMLTFSNISRRYNGDNTWFEGLKRQNDPYIVFMQGEVSDSAFGLTSLRH